MAPPGPQIPPPLVWQGQLWSTEKLTEVAAAWHDAVGGTVARSPGLVALPMASHPEAVALLFALSCFATPIVLLPATLRGWQCVPAIPAGTPLFLPPALRNRAADGARLGLRPWVLGQPGRARNVDRVRFMAAPGFVFFTSGSTGWPRPVYRTMAQLVDAGRAPVTAVGFPSRGGLIGSLPLERTFGMHHGVMAAMVLGRPLALLPRFDHHAVLALFASEDYHYWAATPVMADVLGRCRLPEATPKPHPAPPVCVVSGRLSSVVGDAFRTRFGVPLRQLYGTTETGAVTMDAAPLHLVRSETAGRPLPGVSVRIGDDPRAPVAPGCLGRVWVSSPGCAPGYGFPPDLDPLPGVDGWWASPDVGELSEDGSLIVAGRTDDCVRTSLGHIVSTAAVAEALEACPGVDEALVVSVGSPAEPIIAALIESSRPLDLNEVRRHVALRLPSWSQPRILQQIPSLPRLASGKPDRLACIARLERPR